MCSEKMAKCLKLRKAFANGVVFVDDCIPFLACAIVVAFSPALDDRSRLCSTSSFVPLLTMPASLYIRKGFWHTLRKCQIPDSLLMSLLRNSKSHSMGPPTERNKPPRHSWVLEDPSRTIIYNNNYYYIDPSRTIMKYGPRHIWPPRANDSYT